jgi:hypothetical protein
MEEKSVLQPIGSYLTYINSVSIGLVPIPLVVVQLSCATPLFARPLSPPYSSAGLSRSNITPHAASLCWLFTDDFIQNSVM